MKRIIIIGATSGIGKAVAQGFIERGWRVGVAGRRQELLTQIETNYPEQVVCQVIDVSLPESTDQLQQLIEKLGGMDLFFLASGVGSQNRALDVEIELRTLRTNCEGFTRMVTAAYHYFKQQGGGHIGVISSIAGTKGLGTAPAYSATKRFQNSYIEALTQLAKMEKLPIYFTDIRPGFVQTDLLNDGARYPMLMQPAPIAKSIIKALEHKKQVVTLDWRYAILVFFWRLITRTIWVRLNIRT